jgi:hypothetical protein
MTPGKSLRFAPEAKKGRGSHWWTFPFLLLDHKGRSGSKHIAAGRAEEAKLSHIAIREAQRFGELDFQPQNDDCPQEEPDKTAADKSVV